MKSEADARLWLASSILFPLLLRGRPDVRTEDSIWISECRYLPESHCAVLVGADQQPAIWAERDPVNAFGSVDEPEGHADGLAGGWIPQLHGSVLIDAEQATIRAEHHPLSACSGVQDADWLAGGRIPQPHVPVTIGAGQQPAIGAERHPVHAVGADDITGHGEADGGVQDTDRLAGGRIPQPHGPVLISAG